MASWYSGSGACLPFFPFSFSFSFGVFVTPGLMEWELEGAFPSGCPLSALGLPCLRTSSCGHWRQSLAGSSVLRDGCWCLFKTLLFPSYATRCRYDVPGVLASGSGLVAMLAVGALELPLVLVLAFHSSLFLVGGSSDGSVTGDHFLSPGRMCLITPFRLRSVANALSLSESWLFLLLWICRCVAVGSSGAVPRGNF